MLVFTVQSFKILVNLGAIDITQSVESACIQVQGQPTASTASRGPQAFGGGV